MPRVRKIFDLYDFSCFGTACYNFSGARRGRRDDTHEHHTI